MKKKNGTKISVSLNNDILNTKDLRIGLKPDFEEEKIKVSDEQSAQIKELELNVLRAKVELSDMMMQIHEMQLRQQHVMSVLKEKKEEMINVIRTVAKSYGIDPDGILDEKRWNLNTSDMIFYRIK